MDNFEPCVCQVTAVLPEKAQTFTEVILRNVAEKAWTLRPGPTGMAVGSSELSALEDDARISVPKRSQLLLAQGRGDVAHWTPVARLAGADGSALLLKVRRTGSKVHFRERLCPADLGDKGGRGAQSVKPRARAFEVRIADGRQYALVVCLGTAWNGHVVAVARSRSVCFGRESSWCDDGESSTFSSALSTSTVSTVSRGILVKKAAALHLPASLPMMQPWASSSAKALDAGSAVSGLPL